VPGTGKSYAMKALALRHRFLGVEVLILDPEGEYGRLSDAVGGQIVRFAVSRGSHLNPFDLPPVETDADRGETSDPVTEQAAALGGLLEVLLVSPGRLSPDERAALDRAVLATYAAAGIRQGQPETWDREVPLLRDLHRSLEESGTPEDLRLALLLGAYVRGGAYAGVFDRPTDVRLANPFVVFDVSRLFADKDVPESLRAAAVQVVTTHVWRTVRQERRPRLFIADEAKTLLQHPDSARFVGEMARRCRKYWMGLCVAVQRLDHLQHSPEGLDVLTGAGAKLILGHRSEDVGPVVEAFDLPDADRRDLVAASKGEGLFLTRGERAFVRVLASPEEHRLYTTRPDEVAAIEAEDRQTRRGRPTNGHAGVASQAIAVSG
jgi:type IV secretory pathway VirB4 component